MGKYLVIGGSSGIGKALVEELAGGGHEVVATYRETASQDSHYVSYHYYDVTDEVSPHDFIPDVLDGLVYCPGSINLKPFKRIQSDDFVDDFKLQVVGAIRVIQSALSALKKGYNPSIVLFSTVAVHSGYNFHTQVSVSKGAIEGLTKSLAAELAPKVRVNCIAPSLTNTPLASMLLNTEEKKQANAVRNPMKKIGTPTDIANAAAYLLSDKANWITGQVMHVDGGASTLKV